MLRRIVILLVILFTVSCRENEKFDREKWINASEETSYSARKEMSKDLLERYQFIGLKYADLTKLLGSPANSINKDGLAIYYPLYIHYGGIDPDFGIDLIFHLNKDSTVISDSVTEWGHKTFDLF